MCHARFHGVAVVGLVKGVLMTDRILCMSRPFLDAHIYHFLGERGIQPKDIDVDEIISEIRKTGRAELVLQKYGQRTDDYATTATV